MHSQHVKAWFGSRETARRFVHLCSSSAIHKRNQRTRECLGSFLCVMTCFLNVVCTQELGLCLENRVPEHQGEPYWFWGRWDVVKSIARAFSRSVPNTRFVGLCPVIGLRKQISRLKCGVGYSSTCHRNPGMIVILADNQSSVQNAGSGVVD